MARRSEDHDWQPPTPRFYAGSGHVAHADCGRCQRRATLDLVTLAAGPHALTPLIHLPLKCAGCGSTTFTIAIEYAGAYKPMAPP
jgi:hypothetical protein